MTKLKLLAARLQVEGFDETNAPWNSVKELMDARHQLAHPKPAPVTRTFRVVTTPSVFEDEASRSELLWNYRYPILAAGKLELIAKDVISSLDLLLAADGQDSSMLTTMSSSEVEVDWHEIVNS